MSSERQHRWRETKVAPLARDGSAGAPLLAVLLLLVMTSLAHSQALDQTWRVTVNGQTVMVNPDGTFIIPNITAPDSFGPGGPGTRPDFISDDFVRLIGISTAGEITRYVFSEPFKIIQGETIFIAPQDLIFTVTAPPFPRSIMLSVAMRVLTDLGDTTQATVTGTLADGSTANLTPQTAWTSYRTSNFNIADVDANGRVTAVREGTAFITAINEGATSTVRVTVSPGDLLTTLEGIVHFADGSPAVGAEVSIQDQGVMATVDENGRFVFEGVATGLGETLSVSVQLQSGNDLFIGGATGLAPVPAGFTDAGIIVLEPVGMRDTDGDGVPDAIELAMGTDLNNPDSDGDGTSDGEEDKEGDGLPDWVEFVLGTDSSLADSDGDGTDDIDEDTDGDGLPDGQEVVLGTDYMSSDTDGDGFGDNDEVTAGSNPTDPGSVPIFSTHSPRVRYRYLNPSEGNTDFSKALSPVIRYRYLNLSEGGSDFSEAISDTVRYRYLNLSEGSADFAEAISPEVRYRYLVPEAGAIAGVNVVSGTVIYKRN